MLPIEATEHAGLAGRHRRDRQGDLRRERGLGRGRRRGGSVPTTATPPRRAAAMRSQIRNGRRFPRQDAKIEVVSWPTCSSPLGTWNWLIFGFILMALELLAPGVFMFWLGLAALLVGLLSFVISPSVADAAR